jgi:hypothetical protein
MTVGDLIEALQRIPRHWHVEVPSTINQGFDELQHVDEANKALITVRGGVSEWG